MAPSSPSAIGRSKWLPSFSKSAGARLTVIRFGGSARPSELNAARTRSRLSPTALSGKPTMEKAGNPLATCTCTSMSRQSMPAKATVGAWVVIAQLSRHNDRVAHFDEADHD